MSHLKKAIKAYKGSDRNLKEYSEHAAQVSGVETRMLADAIGVSPDTVENHRNAYKLYYELGRHFENPEPVRLWEILNFTIWATMAKKASAYGLSYETTLEHLEHAEGMTVREFRQHIDDAENPSPAWVRSIRNVVRSLKKLLNGYMSEMPPDKQKIFRCAVNEFLAKLKELMED